MGVRLLRESSDIPNITNRDDCHMIRYAYGNQNGILKGFAGGLYHSISGSKFIIHSGRIVLYGWEVDVDGAGWELDLSSISWEMGYTIYLEVNVSTEEANIKTAYISGPESPEISLGDDLTVYPEGTARLPLYTFVFDGVNKVFQNVVRQVKPIIYSYDAIQDIEERLDKLGFKEGTFSWVHEGAGIAQNRLTRQGNYVLTEAQVTYWDSLTEDGFNGIWITDEVATPYTIKGQPYYGLYLASIPDNMKPTEGVYEFTYARTLVMNHVGLKPLFYDISLMHISDDGDLYIDTFPQTSVHSLLEITFYGGYEAKPL